MAFGVVSSLKCFVLYLRIERKHVGILYSIIFTTLYSLAFLVHKINTVSAFVNIIVMKFGKQDLFCLP